MKLEVIAVHETKDEALTAISDVIYALHQSDWERYGDEIYSIRSLAIIGLPKLLDSDSSGRAKLKTEIAINLQATYLV